MKKEDVKRGFAAMDPERQRAVARKGGKIAHQLGLAHEFTSAEATQAGRKGGKAIAQVAGHMSRIGRKGGLAPKTTYTRRKRETSVGDQGAPFAAEDTT